MLQPDRRIFYWIAMMIVFGVAVGNLLYPIPKYLGLTGVASITVEILIEIACIAVGVVCFRSMTSLNTKLATEGYRIKPDPNVQDGSPLKHLYNERRRLIERLAILCLLMLVGFGVFYYFVTGNININTADVEILCLYWLFKAPLDDNIALIARVIIALGIWYQIGIIRNLSAQITALHATVSTAKTAANEDSNNLP